MAGKRRLTRIIKLLLAFGLVGDERLELPASSV